MTTTTTEPNTVKKAINPVNINVISKPKNEAYDNANIFEALDVTSTISTPRITHITWTNSNDKQETTLSSKTSSNMTKPTTAAPKWRPPYSFKPWKITTRGTTESTTPTTAGTTSVPPTSSTSASTTKSSSSSTSTKTPTTRLRYTFQPSPRVSTATATTSTDTFRSTPKAMVSTTSQSVSSTSTAGLTTIPTSRKPKYSFRPWSRTTRQITTTTISTPTTSTTPSTTASVTSPTTATKSTSTTTQTSSTTTTTITTSTTARTTTRKRRPHYTFRPWSTTTRSTTTMKEVAFKPRLKVTKPSPKATTILPTFRPWTRQPKPTTAPSVEIPSSTRPFFLFAKLSTQKPTPSTSSRLTPRVRSTSRPSKLPSTLTTSDFVTIVKDITFPEKKSTKTTQSPTRNQQQKITKTTVKVIPSSTPKQKIKSDNSFEAATWTTKPVTTTSTTATTTTTTTTPTSTSIQSRNVDLKGGHKQPESEYRKGYTRTTVQYTSTRSTVKSTPTGPQRIFGWMTPSTTTMSTSQTKSTSLTTPSTTKRRTLPTIETETLKPTTVTTAVPTTTSTTAKSPIVKTLKPTLKPLRSISTTTPRSTHRPLMTHSMLEASLGLDHTHPTVRSSPLRKGIRHSELHRQQGGKLVHKPLPRVTPPPVATVPTRTERPYIMNIPKPSDCDNNDDIRQPDHTRQLQNNQRLVGGNDFIPLRQKHIYKQRQPQRGYIIQNFNDGYNEYRQPTQSYNVETRLKAWPKRLLQPTLRHQNPRNYIDYRYQQQRPQMGYNIPHQPMKLQPQRIVVDYKVPGGKYKTVQQQNRSPPQQRPVQVQDIVKKPESTDFKCPSVFGIFPDRTDCRKFHQCVWFVPFHHMCGKGTVWNDSMKICDWPQSVTSCLT